PEHPVELADSSRRPRMLGVGDILQRGDLWRVDLAGPAAASRRARTAGLLRRGGLDHELTERVPLATLGALALPLVVVGAAVVADVGDLGLGGGSGWLGGDGHGGVREETRCQCTGRPSRAARRSG